jgi:hypothetical protein
MLLEPTRPMDQAVVAVVPKEAELLEKVAMEF